MNIFLEGLQSQSTSVLKIDQFLTKLLLLYCSGNFEGSSDYWTLIILS